MKPTPAHRHGNCIAQKETSDAHTPISVRHTESDQICSKKTHRHKDDKIGTYLWKGKHIQKFF